MKKIVMFLVMFLMLSGIAVVHAQERAGAVNIAPTIGMYIFEGNEDIDKSFPTPGLRLGYNFTKYIGIEGFVNYAPTEINSIYEKPKVEATAYGVEGIFNILPDGKFVPFLAVGVGGIHYSTAYDFTTEDKKNKFIADYGYGVKYYFTENFALRLDVRHIIPFSDVHNNFLASVGLNFTFGGAKKAAEPVAVIDSDKDGVPDDMDRCPDTPAGVAVDKYGCPLDSDKDGVPDYLDKCPGTPVGVKVDKDGCPPPIVEEAKPQPQKAPEIIEKGRTTLNVLFDTNKAIIKKNSFRDVDNLAAVMKQYPDLNVIIEGHTDNVGGAAYNKKLSQKRADAVKEYMVKKCGIDAKRLTAKGFGMDKPIASNATKAGKAKNRRVEAAVEYIIKK